MYNNNTYIPTCGFTYYNYGFGFDDSKYDIIRGNALSVLPSLVKNEERFLWYAINSILPFVDKIMIWDTGSTDKTVEILKLITSPKISFKEVRFFSSISLSFPRFFQRSGPYQAFPPPAFVAKRTPAGGGGTTSK